MSIADRDAFTCSIRIQTDSTMKDQAIKIPFSTQRELHFENGTAIGTSQRWHKGQYCSVITPVGIVGCGIYDLKTAEEFDQAIAIAKGTPENPLVEPEDLFDAKIVGTTARAAEFGINVGDTGRSAVETMLSKSKDLESD